MIKFIYGLLPKEKNQLLLLIALIFSLWFFIYDIYYFSKNINKGEKIKVASIYNNISKIIIGCDDGINEGIEYLSPKTIKIKIIKNRYSRGSENQYILIIKPIINESGDF